MHCPFTSEISVKRERGILILVMRYFYRLFNVGADRCVGPQPPPPFTPLYPLLCTLLCPIVYFSISDTSAVNLM